MGKKKKEKKINAKKEKYAKFRREKPATLDISMPDLDDGQRKEKQQADQVLDRFFRYNRNPPTKPNPKKKDK